jgi:hypothetical protein
VAGQLHVGHSVGEARNLTRKVMVRHRSIISNAAEEEDERVGASFKLTVPPAHLSQRKYAQLDYYRLSYILNVVILLYQTKSKHKLMKGTPLSPRKVTIPPCTQ